MQVGWTSKAWFVASSMGKWIIMFLVIEAGILSHLLFFYSDVGLLAPAPIGHKLFAIIGARKKNQVGIEWSRFTGLVSAPWASPACIRCPSDPLYTLFRLYEQRNPSSRVDSLRQLLS
jgi:hypothetical protein